MVGYGYADWEGDDRHFMGWAGTGVHFDPIIADNAAHWLRENANRSDQPWFLTVALVNPHDVMWFPMDQPDYQASHPEDVAFNKAILEAAKWTESDPIPPFEGDYEESFSDLPANFDDDLHTKPDTQRQWRWDQQHGFWGYIDPKDKRSWLRQLDYYAELHRLADQSLGTVLSALEESGRYDDTIVIFTSDHGDMCGGHGLRSKGPFVYNEIMNVPCYVKVPGTTAPGSSSASLASHVDLAPTICALAGVDPAGIAGLQGTDLSPLLAEPAIAPREHVLFAMDSVHTSQIRSTRYAIRGMFDGRFKYSRYYGVGGGIPNDDFERRPSSKLYDVGADFDDQDHELYDLAEDPHELVNLANDRGRRTEVRERFALLRALERRELEAAVPVA